VSRMSPTWSTPPSRSSVDWTFWSTKQYDRVMGVNVRAAFQLTMLCAPHLIAARGNIVNVSSIAGTRSLAGLLAYSMSKSAVEQMTGCPALELASKGVRVNSVNPGVIVTPIYKGTGMSEVRKSTPKSLNITKKLCRWVALAMRRKWRRRLLFWLPVLHHSAPANIFTSTADGKPPALADS